MSNVASAPSRPAQGVAAAFGSYLIWGIVPLYWKLLNAVDPTELIAHRITWSLVFLLVIQTVRRRLGALREAFRYRGSLIRHFASGALLTANWLIYIWGVQQGRVIECSLGYFLVPLLNAALGRLVLGERLGTGQRLALALASAGVTILIAQVGHVPWVALGLAASFGFYGLLRKQSAAGPLTGLTLETVLMLPGALAYLVWAELSGQGAIGRVDTLTTFLVFSTGIVTAIPLLLFGVGARQLRLTTLGLLQYVAPTCQFLLGWLVFHEPFSRGQAAAFALIWAGLACYTFAAWRAGQARPDASGG